MAKSINEIVTGLLTDWLFSPSGTALLAVVWSAILAFLAYLTKGLDTYEPVAYWVAVTFGITSGLIIVRFLLSIFLMNTQGIKTSKPTFVEYRIEENHSLVLTAKSNIYNEPRTQFVQQTIIPQQAPLQQNRRNRNVQQTPQPAPQNIQTLQHLAAQFVIIFEKPISSVHLQIEVIAGTLPVRGGHSADTRFAYIELTGIQPNSAFRIKFN